MKNQFKNFSLFIIGALICVLFVNCQKESANVINDKIVISSTKVSAITQIRATISASITSNGGNEITERGVCYDTMPNPTIASMKMVYDSAKVDSFSLRISQLRPNKKYYARAYATNSKGTGYGEEVSFTTHSVQLGDFFQGGTVFYIDATGTHGLIAALQGLDYSAEWGCKGVSIPGTTTIVGSGKANTVAITKGCKTAGISARWADQLENLGFTDWYLPSKDELTEMFKQRKIVVLNDAARWSSSEANANSAWALTFDATGAPVSVMMDKSTVLGVRPIRAFSY